MERLKLNIQFFASNSASTTLRAPVSATNTEYTLTASFNENSTSTSNNTSNVTCTASLKDVLGTFTSKYDQKLQIYWFDNNANTNGKLIATTIVKETTKGATYTASGTIDVTHKNDGSLSGYAKAVWVKEGDGKYVPNSGEIATPNTVLTSIPRATTLDSFTCATAYLDGTYTVKFTSAATTFYHKLLLQNASGTTIKTVSLGQCGSTSQLSKTTTFTTTELTTLYGSATANSAYMTIQAKLQTYSDSSYSTLVGTSSAKTLSLQLPTSVKPSVSISSFAENTSGIASTFGAYIQNKSTIKGAVTAAGVYNSTIKSYSIKINGATYTSSSFTTGVLKTSGSNTCTVTVTDSRGRTNTVTKTFTVLAYTPPKITTYKVTRSTDAKSATATINCSISSLNSKNTKSIVLKYRKSGASTYTTAFTKTDAYSYNSTYTISGLDPASTYDITLEVKDYFSTNSFEISITSLFRLMNFLASGKGIGFGKMAEREGFDFGGDVYYKNTELIDLFYPIGSYLYTSNTSYNPNSALGGTWTSSTSNGVVTWHRTA